MTQARRSELAPRAVVDALPEAVLIFGRDGAPALTNRAADDLFAGRPVRSLPDLLERFAGLPPTDDSPVPVEAQLRDEPGRRVELRLVRLPDHEATGVIVRDVGDTIRDWVDRDDFLGVLSHELRTPITTLYAGSTVLAHDERLPAHVKRELAADMASEAGRLFRAVEDLLALARLDSGGLDVTIEPLLLQRVVADVVRTERALWRDREVVAVIRPGLPPVAADARVVAHVVRNLVAEAARAGGEGCRIEVHAEPSVESERPAPAPAATEVVVRARVSTAPHGRASGDAVSETPNTGAAPGPADAGATAATAPQTASGELGVVAVRRLVEAMGGRAWVADRKQHLEFAFALPAYPDETRSREDLLSH
jgi:signal transduction histidine kinase